MATNCPNQVGRWNMCIQVKPGVDQDTKELP